MKKRVVITGLGVVAPNGVGIDNFRTAIKNGQSGIRFLEQLKKLNFSCCVGGIPEVSDELAAEYLSPLQLRKFNSSGILYGCIAGIDAWKDAGLTFSNDQPDWDSGCIFGTGISGVEKFKDSVYLLDAGKVKRLGSNAVVQTMASGVGAYLNNIIGFGNQVTTNSSACTTGTEAVLLAYDRIASGQAKRILAGSTSDHGEYIWGGFDAMKVMNFKSNDQPSAASRPMSATAAGFVPGSGAGAMVIESLESAQARNATIYAEILGGQINSGGQRNGGTMTAPNNDAVQRCIRQAITNAGITPDDIDLINGHLTATTKDPEEIKNWATALGRSGKNFPYIHSLKSMVGHCIAAAGSIELVAACLGLKENFIFPSINTEDIHPDILEMIDAEKIPSTVLENKSINIVAKAGFGFGDINACIVLKGY